MANVVTIPEREWLQIKRLLKKVEKMLETTDEMPQLKEDEAAELLGIKVGTLRNKVYKEQIKPSSYVKIGAKRFYFKDKLLKVS